MIDLIPSTNTFVCAPVCSGKTYLLRQWLLTHNTYVRFDYTGETMKESDPTVTHVYKPAELADKLEETPYYFRVAYHPGKNVMEHYRWCQRILWQLDNPRLLALDEMHRVCPQMGRLDDDVETAVRLARHNQLGILGMSQRPQDVHKLYIDSCRLCVIFRSQEENFLNAVAGHWGRDTADACAALRPLIYNDVTGEVKQVQQCIVITRDGHPPRVYDFATDTYITVAEFLEGKNPPEKPNAEEAEAEEGPSENADDAFYTDLDAQRPQNGSVPDGERTGD